MDKVVEFINFELQNKTNGKEDIFCPLLQTHGFWSVNIE